MSNRSGTNYSAPTDADRRPVVMGVSTADGITPLPLEVDPNTGELQVTGGSGGSSNVTIHDGASATKATVLALSDSNPIAVGIVDTNGDQISSFGGGTQYTDAASAPTHPVGTAVIFKNTDAGEMQVVDISNGLPFQPDENHLGSLGASSSLSVILSTDQTAIESDLSTIAGNPVLTSIAGVQQVTVDDANGNGITSSTIGSIQGLDVNLAGSGGSAFSTAGFIDIKGADGDVFIQQATAANLNATVVGTGTFAVQASLNAGTNAIGGITGAGSNAQIKDDSFYGDGVTSGLLTVHNRVWNGSSYDRWHGDTTNGAWVNVKAGSITANAGTNLNTSALALESGGNLATLAGTVSSSKVNINISSGSIANTSFAATQSTASNLKAQITGAGSAGTADSGVVTVQGIASMTHLLVTPDANSAINNAQIGGNTISTDVGTSGNGTQRIVQANGAGRTLKSAGGSASSSGNNTLVTAGTNKLKVFAFSLTTTSSTAVTCIFQDGASGTTLWEVTLQAPTSVSVGANLAVTPPAFLFATSSATLLNLNLSGAQTVIWSVAYFDEA